LTTTSARTRTRKARPARSAPAPAAAAAAAAAAKEAEEAAAAAAPPPAPPAAADAPGLSDDDRATLAGALRDALELEDASDDEIARLVAACSVVAYENERIIQQGSLDNEFYVIRSGEVKFSIDMDGTDTEIGALEAGRFFGEGALLSNKPRRASADAAGKCELWCLTREGFLG